MALEAATERAQQGPPGTQLFLEFREDLTVSFDPDQGPVSQWHTTLGATARWGLNSAHEVALANPSPDDLMPLLDSAESGQPVARTPSWEARPCEGWSLDLTDVTHQVSEWGLNLQRALQPAHTRATASAFRQKIWIAGGAGLQSDTRRSARLQATATDGTRLDPVGETSWPHFVAEEMPFRAIPLEAWCERWKRRAVARPITSGELPILFAQGSGGVVAHELLGHGLEADAPPPAWLKIGQTVGPRGWTLLDDPRRGRSPWRIDDEGVVVRVARLVQDGVVRGALHDQSTARHSGSKPTGHGRRHSFRDPIQPRMGCTFIARGVGAADDLMQGIESGLWIRRIDAAQVDVHRGRATLHVGDADRIERGRRTDPVSRCVVVLESRESLNSLEGVAEDLTFCDLPSNCLKRSQPLVVTVGAPTIRLGMAKVNG